MLLKPSPQSYKDYFDLESLAQNQSRYCFESNHHEGMSYDTVFVLVLLGTYVMREQPL